MRVLVDTHVLIWMATGNTSRLSKLAINMVGSKENEVWFSAISILEIAIKQSLGRADFALDAAIIRDAFLALDFRELAVNGIQSAFVARLPLIHRDPFDRLLIAQANIEGMTLITADEQIARYPGPILKI
jgi:PIN domain nuclease of toxin-antitoxin system